MLDESALRRPTFTDGPKVKLGDGQEWTFPKPMWRVFPVPKEDGSFAIGGNKDPYGPRHQADLERLMDVQGDNPEDGSERIDICIRLAGELLYRNYALDAPAFESLLPMDGTPENHEMWSFLHLVIRGIAPTPKPGAVG